MAANKDSLLAVVHEFLLRKDRNLATVFKSKCNSVRKELHVVVYRPISNLFFIEII